MSVKMVRPCAILVSENLPSGYGCEACACDSEAFDSRRDATSGFASYRVGGHAVSTNVNVDEVAC